MYARDGMSTEEAEARAERIAVQHGRGQAVKQTCKHCDGKKRALPLDGSAKIGEQAGDLCSVCGGYGYIYRIGDSGSSRTVPQLLGRSPTTRSKEGPGDDL